MYMFLSMYIYIYIEILYDIYIYTYTFTYIYMFVKISMWNEGESRAFQGNPPRIYPVLNANYRRPIVRFDDVLAGASRL